MAAAAGTARPKVKDMTDAQLLGELAEIDMALVRMRERDYHSADVPRPWLHTSGEDPRIVVGWRSPGSWLMTGPFTSPDVHAQPETQEDWPNGGMWYTLWVAELEYEGDLPEDDDETPPGALPDAGSDSDADYFAPMQQPRPTGSTTARRAHAVWTVRHPHSSDHITRGWTYSRTGRLYMTLEDLVEDNRARPHSHSFSEGDILDDHLGSYVPNRETVDARARGLRSIYSPTRRKYKIMEELTKRGFFAPVQSESASSTVHVRSLYNIGTSFHTEEALAVVEVGGALCIADRDTLTPTCTHRYKMDEEALRQWQIATRAPCPLCL